MPEEGARDEMSGEMTGGEKFGDADFQGSTVKNEGVIPIKGTMTFQDETVFDGDFKDGFYDKGKLTFKEGPTFIGENDGFFTPDSFKGTVTDGPDEYEFEFSLSPIKPTEENDKKNIYVVNVGGTTYNVRLKKIVEPDSESSSSAVVPLVSTSMKPDSSVAVVPKFNVGNQVLFKLNDEDNIDIPGIISDVKDGDKFDITYTDESGKETIATDILAVNIQPPKQSSALVLNNNGDT